MGRRTRTAEMLPGMPDTVGKLPPKASTRPPARTLDEAIARTHDIIGEALDRFPIVARQVLMSGGGDSTVLLDIAKDYLDSSADDAIVHVNTGTGIPETTQFVRETANALGLPLRELHPRDSYEDLVLGKVIARTGANAGKRQVWLGFPGPAGHAVMYRRLKDEPLMRNRAATLDGRHGRSHKVLYLAGMRWDESDRRMRNAQEIDPQGGIVWCSPLAHWTNAQMAEYRRTRTLPRNEVTDHLHMSGECLCGAYAKEGELEEIDFFYPAVAKQIRDLEKKVADAGIRNCKWGKKPPSEKATNPGRLCSACAAPDDDLVTEWVTNGLMTAEQAAALTAPREAS